MSAPVPMSRGRCGFSLIEVLVVIAVAGVLLAVGVGRQRRDADGPTLRAAEAELVSLLTLARTHALRLNRATRLFVELGPTAEAGGQRFFIMELDPNDGSWQPVGRLHRLGVHAVVVSDVLPDASAVGGAGEEMASTFHGETNAAWADEPSYPCGYVHFSPTGTSFGTPQLVLVPARPQADGWTISQPQRARRLLVRPGGSVTARSASPLP